MRRILMNGVPLLACAVLLSLGRVSAYQKTDPQAFSGTWKLDLAASTNPNGPSSGGAGATRAPQGGGGGGSARGGGGGGSTGGGGGDAGGGGGGGVSGGGSGGGSLGVGERQRFYAMLKILTQAPATLAIAATGTEVTLTPDASKAFHHLTNGKPEKLAIGENFGDLEIKTKWDGATLKRELKTIDGLTVAEAYTLAGDGKQLLMSIDLKSQVERLPDAMRVPIKRVYNRVQ